jgi:hypothetical protein
MKNNENEFKVAFLVFFIIDLYVIKFVVEICFS